MKSDTTIRPMEAGDIDKIARVFAHWNKTVEQYRRYFEENRRGGRVTLVALRGDEVIGYANVLWDSYYEPFRCEGIPEINDLNVLEGFQGQGIATELIRRCEEIMKTKGKTVSGIGVGLTPDYARAQRLYPHLSYIHDGRPDTTSEWGPERHFTRKIA